jgi:hypothetical protein
MRCILLPDPLVELSLSLTSFPLNLFNFAYCGRQFGRKLLMINEIVDPITKKEHEGAAELPPKSAKLRRGSPSSSGMHRSCERGAYYT